MLQSDTQRIRGVLQIVIASTDQFLEWCRDASAMATCIYHVGSLGLDRSNSADLNNLAEIATILAAGDFLVLGQHKVPLVAGRQTAYTATRTTGGHAPRSILTGEMAPIDYRALRALDDSNGYQSSTRVIRDELSCSDMAAAAIVSALRRKGLIERGPQRQFGTPGEVLTTKARRLML